MPDRLPAWFKRDIPENSALALAGDFSSLGLHTVCCQARCPNWGECFKNNTATFLILGDTCTRSCSFCAIKKSAGGKLSVDAQEPQKIACAVKKLSLKYCVITSVTRDDLVDGGAGIFAAVITEIRLQIENIKVEALIPDFQGDISSLKQVIAASPDILSHNLETVPRLYKEVRQGSDYQRSLEVLANIKRIDPGCFTKSSLMLGLGESEEELISVFKDLRRVSCDILILGQYLRPSENNYPVKEFIAPERFAFYADLGYTLGFKKVCAKPNARSSFKAEEIYREMCTNSTEISSV